MMQARNMADVIDLAVNEYLWDGLTNNIKRPANIYSCSAIAAADNRHGFILDETMDFLRSFGLDTDSTVEFQCISFGEKRQYARALWLTWAAMIAREEGKTLKKWGGHESLRNS